MSEVITREQAIARGLKRYRDGSACCHGHTGERYARDKACCVCNAEHHRMMRRNGYTRPLRRRVVAPTKTPLAEVKSASSFIAPPTRAQLMARR
jgi:hypothetical protein